MHPKEPAYSCPFIDGAISEMENARKIHDELRQWGHHWKETAEDIEKESSKKIEELEEDVSKLDTLVEKLSAEIRDMRSAAGV